jgi:hypothetical protein
MEEILEELKIVRRELLNLRNDVLYVQHVMTKLEKKLDKLSEPKKPQENLENLYGSNTTIEKF